MNRDCTYHRPSTLAEAVDYLATKGGETTIIAGGTDVMVDLRAGKLERRNLLDVSRLDELRGIRLEGEKLVVGAAVTLAEIHRSPLLANHAPALQKCARNFASAQIRNKATIGGNVGHCSPCGDTIPPLVIHQAEMVCTGSSGQRRLPITEVATGAYRCQIARDEIITAFVLEPVGADFADFQKIGRRQALAISRMSMAAMLNQDQEGRITMLRLALGACTPTPCRLRLVEEFLLGKKPQPALLMQAGELLAEQMIAITGRRSSIIYKEPAVQGLFRRILSPVACHD